MIRPLLVGVFLALSSHAFAAPILINGSFELGLPPFTVHDLGIPAGSTAISGWTVTGGGVDLLEDPWDVPHGVRAVDLDQNSPGGIEQAFATAVGRSYIVTFELSGNPEGGSVLKPLRVAVGGASQDFVFDTTNQAKDALEWDPITFGFVASTQLTILSFTSLSFAASSYGALIDNVAVQVVPEPAPWQLAVSGFALWWYRFKRRPQIP